MEFRLLEYFLAHTLFVKLIVLSTIFYYIYNISNVFTNYGYVPRYYFLQYYNNYCCNNCYTNTNSNSFNNASPNISKK